jgi:hypothetical protein
MWASSVAANKDDWIVPLESFAELVYGDSTREVKPGRLLTPSGQRKPTHRRFAGAC